MYYYKNGSVFKGRWSFDKKNGFGILTKSDGTVQSGIWEHDYYKLDQSGNSVIKSTKEDLKYTKPKHPAFLIIDNLQKLQFKHKFEIYTSTVIPVLIIKMTPLVTF